MPAVGTGDVDGLALVHGLLRRSTGGAVEGQDCQGDGSGLRAARHCGCDVRGGVEGEQRVAVRRVRGQAGVGERRRGLGRRGDQPCRRSADVGGVAPRLRRMTTPARSASVGVGPRQREVRAGGLLDRHGADRSGWGRVGGRGRGRRRDATAGRDQSLRVLRGRDHQAEPPGTCRGRDVTGQEATRLGGVPRGDGHERRASGADGLDADDATRAGPHSDLVDHHGPERHRRRCLRETVQVRGGAVVVWVGCGDACSRDGCRRAGQRGRQADAQQHCDGACQGGPAPGAR